MSTFRKKVFSEAPLKCFFLYSLNNSDSVVFENADFEGIKDQILKTKPFQKRFLLWEF